MSFFPSTSLTPTVVALSAFFLEHFPNVDWYPYWYLGNPYYYLIGPVVPVALSILSLFRVPVVYSYPFFIFGSFFIAGVGIHLLLRSFGIKRVHAFAAALIYVVAPGGFVLLFFQDGLGHIAFGFLPYLALLYKKLLDTRKLVYAYILSFFLSVLLLTTMSIFLSYVVVMSAFFMTYAKRENTGKLAAQTVLLSLLSLSLATIWYTPSFWLTVLTNPSFGGAPLYRLAWSIFDFTIQLLPLILAITIVKWQKFRIKGPFAGAQGFHPLLFGMLIFIVFFSLTVVRFISDPDFVIDWIGFLLELQFGIAIIVGSVSGRFIKTGKAVAFSVALFAIVILLDCYIVNNLAIQQFSNSGHAYQKKILTILKDNIPKEERVFLSGTPVFWINAYRNQMQVRGGSDGVSVHPFWRHAAFQIREGKDPLLTRDLLLVLGTPYILVHKGDSEEVFRDFKIPAKFESPYFQTVSGGDDALYRVNSEQVYGIARVADGRIVRAARPKKGDDALAIHNYVSLLKSSASAVFQKPNRLVVSGKLDNGEVVSLAVAYHLSWRIDKGEGRIIEDAFGNIVIMPEKSGEQQFILSFQRKTLDIALPIFASLVFCLALLYHESISQFFSKVFSRLSFGLSENEEE